MSATGAQRYVLYQELDRGGRGACRVGLFVAHRIADGIGLSVLLASSNGALPGGDLVFPAFRFFLLVQRVFLP
jgi:hypothetical protein